MVERFNHLANINILHKLQAISLPKYWIVNSTTSALEDAFFTVDG